MSVEHKGGCQKVAEDDKVVIDGLILINKSSPLHLQTVRRPNI